MYLLSGHQKPDYIINGDGLENKKYPFNIMYYIVFNPFNFYQHQHANKRTHSSIAIANVTANIFPV